MPSSVRLAHDLLQFVKFALEQLVGHDGRVEQNLDGGDAAAAVLLAHQALRNDALQIARQIHEQLLAALFRKEIDDAIERLVGAVGMQRAHAQVPGLREGDRVLHGFGIANFADQNHIGRLAQGIFQCVMPGVRIDARRRGGSPGTSAIDE